MSIEKDKEAILQEISDIGQEAHTDHPMRHWDRTCPACVAEADKQEPVAWVRDLTSPQPHCVTSMKYLSIADTDAGVKYIPVYTAPPKREWVGLTDEEIAQVVGSPLDEVYLTDFRRVIAKLKEKNT